MPVSSILQIFAGVGILIYGIVVMGESLQIIAGEKLRKLIASLTGTPLKGLLVGTVVTGILQSSGATTVMVVSFVDVGFMTLTQAIGVILGANIGTTVTAQLIAFKITNVAYLCALGGAAICILCKKKRTRQIGVCMMGFGLLFIGMEMMSGPMSFLKTRTDIMASFAQHSIIAFIAGFVITVLVQSSSATVGLTMAVAAQGLITLDTAIIIILGENIGSTTTAVLASLGAKRSAKQAAASHVIIKIIGTVFILLILPFYSSFIQTTSSDIARQVANAHTIFNVIIALLFLPFVSQYAKFIKKIIPNDESEEPLGAMYLNETLITASRAAAVDAVRKEMVRLAGMTRKMIEDCHKIFEEDDGKLVGEVDRLEHNVNDITHEIIYYATEVGQTGLSSDLSLMLNSCVSGVGDVERIGDHATNLVEMYQYMQDHNLKFSPKAQEECGEMFVLVLSAIVRAIQALEDENIVLAQEVVDLEERIDYMEKTLRAQHIARLNAGGCTPGSGVVFIDILSNLERIGDHAHNLAMVVFDIDRMKKND
ncbi:MAG: Na/Pi cotransporter family protein [Synergistaceae bacterium]|nr:Na/Pi cotransporter family protein [Synergistaceae bacterium]